MLRDNSKEDIDLLTMLVKYTIISSKMEIESVKYLMCRSLQQGEYSDMLLEDLTIMLI